MTAEAFDQILRLRCSKMKSVLLAKAELCNLKLSDLEIDNLFAQMFNTMKAIGPVST